MKETLRILLVEDLMTDAEIVRYEIKKAGIQYEDQLVETKEAYVHSLQNFVPDLILSDYALPHFNGMKALQIRNELTPGIPFILVTGSTNEEIAVECMKAGADDYLIKGNLTRMVPAIHAAMEKWSIIHAKDNAEKALQESEKKYRKIFESIQDVFYQVDVSGRITEISPSIFKYSGYTRDELIGKPVEEVYHNPDDREALMTALQHKGEVIDYDVQLRTKDGMIKWASLNIHLMLDAEGKTAGLEGSLREVTSRKFAEESLKESEEKFRTLAESAPYAIMIYQNDYWVYTNQAGEEISGYTADELYQMKFWEFVSEEHREMVFLNGRNRENEKIRKSSYEFKIVTKSGSKKWVYLTGNVIKYMGIPSGIISVIDISDRKHAELALKQSEALLQKIFDILPIGLWLADPSGKLIRGNPAGVRIWGAEPTVGIEEYGVFKARRLPERIELGPEDWALAQTVKEGVTIENELLEIDAFDEKKRIILNFTAPVLDDAGKMLGAIVVNNDITDLKTIEQELIDARDKAEESDRLKSAFLANMSHEIRTPMNGIIGFSELLDDEDLSQDERKKFISIISSSSKHLLALINDIIDLAKIESNQMALCQADFNLNHLLDELFLSFQNEMKRMGKDSVELIVEKPWKDGDSILYSDEIRIRQVLNNLIGNAIKFTSKGSIHFGYMEQKGKLQFFIKDTGKGITDNKKNLIFERFRQEEESNTRQFGGSGLGLPISKGLIELLGGELWMDSTEGMGSTFFFTLPTNPKEAGKQPVIQPKTLYHPASFQGKTILVAEDVYDNYELLEMMLKKTQAGFLYAPNGKEAVELLKQHKSIDLILMDIQMPVLNGYEATREIRKENQTIPIIALTAHAYAEDRQKCMESGCSDFITKPIKKEELLNMISRYLVA